MQALKGEDALRRHSRAKVATARGRNPRMQHVVLALLVAMAAHRPAFAEPTYRAFITNEYDNTLSVLDTRSGTVETTVAVGKRPRGIGLAPDHAHVYVAIGEENAIAVVDTHTLQVLKKLPAGSDPETF